MSGAFAMMRSTATTSPAWMAATSAAAVSGFGVTKSALPDATSALGPARPWTRRRLQEQRHASSSVGGLQHLVDDTGADRRVLQQLSQLGHLGRGEIAPHGSTVGIRRDSVAARPSWCDAAGDVGQVGPPAGFDGAAGEQPQPEAVAVEVKQVGDVRGESAWVVRKPLVAVEDVLERVVGRSPM